MKQEFLHFKQLLEEKQNFLKDELRDNYLIGAMTVLSKNLGLYRTIVDNETILHLVLKELKHKNIHKVRMSKLKILLLDIVENSPVDIINQKNNDGDTVVHLILKNDQFSVGIMDMLHDKGASFEERNNDGDLPIHMVAKSENLDDLKFITGYTSKQNINAQNISDGDTPLMIAIKNQKINNVYFLLEQNADVFKSNYRGETPKDLALNILREKNNETAQQIFNIVDLFEEKHRASKKIEQMVTKKTSEDLDY